MVLKKGGEVPLLFLLSPEPFTLSDDKQHLSTGPHFGDGPTSVLGIIQHMELFDHFNLLSMAHLQLDIYMVLNIKTDWEHQKYCAHDSRRSKWVITKGRNKQKKSRASNQNT